MIEPLELVANLLLAMATIAAGMVLAYFVLCCLWGKR
jgi:hypothetical protein